MIRRCNFLFIFFVMSFSLYAENPKNSGEVRELKIMIKKDYPNRVNSDIRPPQRECIFRESDSIEDQLDEGMPKNKEEDLGLNQIAKVDDSRQKLFDNYKKMGGDPIAFEQAMCFFDKYKSTKFKAEGDPSRSSGIKIDNQRYVTINDMNVTMAKSRFYVLDLETGKVNTYFSAHGYGGKKGVQESDMVLEEASNVDGSNASPRGFFITGTRREGSSDPRWAFSMKLHGLQKGVNDKSFSRAVIVHPFPKMPPESASSDDPEVKGQFRSEGPFSLSQGCTMLSENYASDIINKTKASSNSTGGSLYYNYSSVEKGRGASYCGEENLMKK